MAFDRRPIWFAESNAFDALRPHVESTVPDGEIRSFLLEHSIATIQDFKKGNMSSITSELRTRLNVDLWLFSAIVQDACHRTKESPEKALVRKRIVFDNSCIIMENYESYSSSAVAVIPNLSTATFKKRNPRFTLVLGSSGSGKTIFAIRRIPELLYADTEYFCVHFKAESVTNLSFKMGLSFPESVTMIVERTISDILRDEGHDDCRLVLKIGLQVTIDEAGGEHFKPYFDSSENIESIVTSLEQMDKYKFTEKVHVTVAGTRLETTTALIDSAENFVKFWTQPWKFEHFKAYVEKSNHEAKERVYEVVQRYPFLEDISSNGRCASFVLQSMTPALLHENQVRGYVNAIVLSVAEHYICSNGLKNLVGAAEKWAVARSVFMELDNAVRQPGVAFYPLFGDLENESHRAIAYTLVDVRVQFVKGKETLAPNCTYALSMSPALAIVVAHLLSTEAKVSLDWKSFETTVVLGEMKRMIVRTQGAPAHPEKSVVQLFSPFPGTNSQYNFSVPVVDRYTVVLNGPHASYADVIAPYRLVQAKFSRADKDEAKLNLQNELNKMGLTRFSDPLHLNVTRFLYTLWEKGTEAPSVIAGKTRTHLVNKEWRCECYPYNTLSSKTTSEKAKMISGRLEKKRATKRASTENKQSKGAKQKVSNPRRGETKQKIERDTKERASMHPRNVEKEDEGAKQRLVENKAMHDVNAFGKGVQLLTSFTGSQVAAVFATNCSKFVFHRKSMANNDEIAKTGNVSTTKVGTGESLSEDGLEYINKMAETAMSVGGTKADVRTTICRDDVDWEGVPKDETIFSNFGLLENVNIRFLFY